MNSYELTDPQISSLLAFRSQFLAIARRATKDPDLAEDVVQETLFKAIKAAPELHDQSRLIPWAFRILKNVIFDAYRRRKRENDMQIAYAIDNSDSSEPSSAEITEICSCFYELLPALKAEYAEVIAGLDLMGDNPNELAEKLGITANNLKVRHHRARQALRKRLEDSCRVCAEHGCLDCNCKSA